MNPLRLQGMVFSGVAIGVAGAAVGFEPAAPRTEIVLLSALITVLGVPHGALDPVLARRLFRVRSLKDWLGFVLGYCALAALAVVAWQTEPLLFLIAFLLISIAHFSGDPPEGTTWLSRVLYGGAAVVLPALLHAGEVTRLFSFLAGSEAAARIVPLLHALGWPWLAGLAAAALHRAGADGLASLELASVGILAFAAPPLLAFTVFFCGMHSARHILRTFASGRSASRLLLAASLAPMVGVLIIAAAAWHSLRGLPLDARIIQIVFVGLAALTLPHIVLVDRVRLSGWMQWPRTAKRGARA